MMTSYEWFKEDKHYRLKKVIPEDIEKKPEIPQSSSIIQKLKAATEKAHQQKTKFMNKFKRNL